jgi:murein L,D-transpeptidase YafK
MLHSSFFRAVLGASVVALVATVGGCGEFSPAYMKPLSAQTRTLLAEKGMTEQEPILIRIFKAESELEIWKQKEDGHFYLFKTYPICSYSGGLGPKVEQGDRQAPEGFYLVDEDQMNPLSKYHLAFNIGFPNAYDRALGHTGADLMVHGDCTSAGCYAMTDGVIEEIYILAREALDAGQVSFQIQAYPFRMTAANMAAHRNDKWYDFWLNLKEGYDYFETTHLAPSVAICDKHYLINAAFVGGARPNPAGACPAYHKLPVVAFKPPKDSDKTVAEASLSKPLGAVLGLSFGTIKPNYDAMTLGPATPKVGK